MCEKLYVQQVYAFAFSIAVVSRLYSYDFFRG